MTPPDYTITSPAGPCGTITTSDTGVVTATVQMLGEPEWDRVLRAGWCDVDWSGHIDSRDWSTFNAWFEAGDRRADFDKDFWVTGLDYDAFVFAYATSLD